MMDTNRVQTRDPSKISNHFNNYLINMAHKLVSKGTRPLDNYMDFMGSSHNTSLSINAVL